MRLLHQWIPFYCTTNDQQDYFTLGHQWTPPHWEDSRNVSIRNDVDSANNGYNFFQSHKQKNTIHQSKNADKGKDNTLASRSLIYARGGICSCGYLWSRNSYGLYHLWSQNSCGLYHLWSWNSCGLLTASTAHDTHLVALWVCPGSMCVVDS